MSEADKYDAIIVGAGPAGLACACRLAQEGREVVVLERAASCGEKNLTGGRMYTPALKKLGLLTDAINEKALERPVTREQVMFLAEGSGLVLDFADNTNGRIQSWTVLHSRFNAWFGEKAEAAGATVACGVRVDRLLEKDGAIIGVEAGGDELFADAVIAADGVNSFIAAQAGLQPQVDEHSVGVGIKEIIALPAKTIEERFQIGADGGAARVILGGTNGIPGGGAIYANRDSISLVCVFNPAKAGEQEQPLPEIFQRFKTDPAILPLIDGGETREYGAHLVMENGWRNVMTQPWKNGLLVAGEAAGYVINTGLIIRGIDLAIMSGMAAADAILQAKKWPDIGAAYGSELESCGLNNAMREASRWPDFMASPRLFKGYPEMATDMFRQLFQVADATPSLKKRLLNSLKKSGTGAFGILADTWKAFRAL